MQRRLLIEASLMALLFLIYHHRHRLLLGHLPHYRNLHNFHVHLYIYSQVIIEEQP